MVAGLFMLPRAGRCIAGTTDSKCDVTMTPSPTKDEVEFILESIAPYLKVDARRSDILSAWSGIRPSRVALRAEGIQKTCPETTSSRSKKTEW